MRLWREKPSSGNNAAYLHQDELLACSSSISRHAQAAVLVGSKQELPELRHLGAVGKPIDPPVS